MRPVRFHAFWYHEEAMVIMGLLDKVHAFQTAKTLMSRDLYNYFRVIESAQASSWAM